MAWRRATPDRAGARPYRPICARTRKGTCDPPMQVVSDTCGYLALFLDQKPLLAVRFAYIRPGIGISAIPKMGTAHSLFALFGIS